MHLAFNCEIKMAAHGRSAYYERMTKWSALFDTSIQEDVDSLLFLFEMARRLWLSGRTKYMLTTSMTLLWTRWRWWRMLCLVLSCTGTRTVLLAPIQDSAHFVQGRSPSRSMNRQLQKKGIAGYRLVMGLLGFLQLFHIIVYLYELVFSDSGLAACDHLSFCLWASAPVKNLISCQNCPTIFVVDIAINSVTHRIHFNLKKA